MSELQVNGVVWEPVPWLPYRATELLRQIVAEYYYVSKAFDYPKVFEWGCGGSTVFFSELSCFIVSVEHDKQWFDDVTRELKRRDIDPVGVHFIPPEPGDIGPDKANPAHYKSGSTNLGPCNFKAYVDYIDRHDAFDIVLVDGMARASCLAHAVSHVKPGGWLVLDNTGDRPYYLAQTLPLFDGWERIDVTGYGPILAYQWTTTFFRNVRLAHYGR